MPMAGRRCCAGRICEAPPAPGEVRVRHTAIAVNFSDVNVRRGGFYIAKPPLVPADPGQRGRGSRGRLGPGVTDVAAATGSPMSAPAARSTKRPAPTPRNATYRPAPGEAAGRHQRDAAAACAEGSHRRADHQSRLSTAARRHDADPCGRERRRAAPDSMVEASRRDGDRHGRLGREGRSGQRARLRPHHPLSRDRFRAAVRRSCRRASPAVFDGVGKDTFIASFDCVRPFGDAGQLRQCIRASPAGRFAPAREGGSLSVSRPAYQPLHRGAGRVRAACGEFSSWCARGVLRIEIGRTYPLRDAAARTVTSSSGPFAGSMVLIP